MGDRIVDCLARVRGCRAGPCPYWRTCPGRPLCCRTTP